MKKWVTLTSFFFWGGGGWLVISLFKYWVYRQKPLQICSVYELLLKPKCADNTYLLIVTFYSLLNYVYFIVFCWTYDMYICKNLMVFIMSSKHCMLMNMVCTGICFKSRFFNVIFTMLCGSALFHTCYVKKNGRILRIRHYLFLIFGKTGKVR